MKKDPYNLHNLASEEKYADLCKELKAELFGYLTETGDPRMKGEAPWDNYPYYFKGLETRHLKPIGERDKH